MPAQEMPAAEVAIDAALVRSLVEAQHPDLAGEPVRPAAFGWDNAIFRLGDDLAVRLPRRAVAVPLVEQEQRWLPELGATLPLPIPTPVRLGRPSDAFPWPWSICPWFDGVTAMASPPTDLRAAAVALGRFLAALHRPAPPDAPANPYRGIPLAERAPLTAAAVERLDGSDGIDGSAVRRRWDELAATPPWTGPPQWLHGDLHPGNLVVAGGRLAAVIDFGDLTAGDPACDLAVAWMLLPPAERLVLRGAYGAADDATWRRARAWALALGLAIAASSADNPSYAAAARATVAAALDDRA